MLDRAAENGNIEIAKLLIESGADVNKTNGELTLSTSLMVAAYNGRSNFCEFLLQNKVDVNKKNPELENALH